MADLDIYYKGNKIFTADDDVRENLNTAGTYCEEDIIVDYKKPTLPPLTNPATDDKVIDGYGYYDDQGVAQTGSFVPPVDTGANGLYKAIIETNRTEIVDNGLTALRSYAQYYNTSLVKVSLPNLEYAGNHCFRECAYLTGVVDLGEAVIGAACFHTACRRTVILKFKNNGNNNSSLTAIRADHLWLPVTEFIGFNYMLFSAANLRSIQFDTVSRIPLGYTSAISNLKTFIIRTPTGCTLISRGTMATDIIYYVPKDILISFYSTATNWATDYDAGRIVGIDEDTTATVGTPFTPTTAATVDHWDKVDLQSYSVGTIDTTNGSITPTHDGRLLIRGLDSSDNILHVTYLQIGTGFDEEQNLLENI